MTKSMSVFRWKGVAVALVLQGTSLGRAYGNQDGSAHLGAAARILGQLDRDSNLESSSQKAFEAQRALSGEETSSDPSPVQAMDPSRRVPATLGETVSLGTGSKGESPPAPDGNRKRISLSAKTLIAGFATWAGMVAYGWWGATPSGPPIPILPFQGLVAVLSLTIFPIAWLIAMGFAVDRDRKRKREG